MAKANIDQLDQKIKRRQGKRDKMKLRYDKLGQKLEKASVKIDELITKRKSLEGVPHNTSS